MADMAPAAPAARRALRPNAPTTTPLQHAPITVLKVSSTPRRDSDKPWPTAQAPPTELKRRELLPIVFTVCENGTVPPTGEFCHEVLTAPKKPPPTAPSAAAETSRSPSEPCGAMEFCAIVDSAK
eukprot:CAMPEP_0195509494 /NCGR_PEP_ID=MMETSP0794_2-20130614/2419_1 /TAXON_ID=515487 /ORGANISM="Stephanopyxis turris, Strain CCMP 815" /LENGTH=124 /DNA_ID=CAMNT_0040636727 /DNA_START=307 /DNA_END=681 /DNA_ORIENTATION=+